MKQFNAAEDSISFPKNGLGDYHQTLSDCVDSIFWRLSAANALLVDSNWREQFSSSPVNYGETRRWDFEIASLNGKPTRKYFHVNIYRLESGRYELNTYIL